MSDSEICKICGDKKCDGKEYLVAANDGLIIVCTSMTYIDKENKRWYIDTTSKGATWHIQAIPNK